MPVKAPYVIAALVAAFTIGIVGGAAGMFSADDGEGASAGPDPAWGSAIGRDAATPTPAATPDAGPFSAQAVLEESGRVVISGVAADLRSGTALVVQRREAGAWVDFPARTTVGADGRYSVWLKTSRSGANKFRMIAPESGVSSAPVVVQL